MKNIKEIKAEMTDLILDSEVLVNAMDLDPEKAWKKQVSAASVIDILLTIIATTYYALNWMFETYKAEVDEKVQAALPGTRQWYYEKAMAFRYGQSVNDDGVYTTPITDDSCLIVKYCAVVEEYNGVLIKVNKANHVPLDNNELQAFIQYMQSIKFAGGNLVITSTALDAMTLDISIVRNAMLLSSLAVAKTTISTAINTYLQTIQPDGVLNKTQLIKAVMAVDGVEDVVINSWVFSHNTQAQNADGQNYHPVSAGIVLENNGLTITDL